MSNVNTNAFTINLNTNVDTSNIQKTLNRQNYVINADFNTYTLVSSIENTLSQAEKIVDESWSRIGRTMQTGLSGNFLGKDFHDLVRYVEKYKDALGNVYEVSNVLTGDGDMLLNRGFQQLKTTTEEVTETTNTFFRTVENGNQAFNITEKQVQTISDAYGTLTTTVQQYYNEQGKLVETTIQQNEQGNIVGTQQRKIGEATRELTTEITKEVDEQGRLVEITRELDGEFELNRKVITKWTDDVGRANKKVQEFANNGQTLVKSLNTITNSSGLYSGTTTLNKSTNYDKNTNTQVSVVESLDSAMNKVITTTKRWYDAQGNLHTQIAKTNEQGDALARTIDTVTQSQQGQLNTSKEVTAQMQKNVQTLNSGTVSKAFVTTTEELTNVNGIMQKVTTTVTQYTNNMGQLVTETTRYNNTTKQMSTHTETVNQQLEKQNKGIGNLRIGFGKLIERVSGYYIASIPMRAITKIISEAKEAVFEYDKALTELKKVQDFTNESLAEFNKQVAELSTGLATPANELVEAITQFKKSSYDLADSQELAKVSIMMKNTADSTISASDSASALIAVMKAYNLTVEDAIKVTDAINNVSAKYAVSSGDITNNIQKVASVMAETNTSYAETLGLMTAIVEVTRDASIASSALKTISQRIRGVSEDGEELGDMTGKLQGAFRNLGIDIEIVDKDTQEMASTFEILEAVAMKWDTLTEAQRQYIGELMAGKLRITQLDALMRNFNTAIEATADAIDSAGVTEKQYEVQLDSLQGKLNAIQTEFVNMVNEGGYLNDILKEVLDTLTELLKVAGNIIKDIDLKSKIKELQTISTVLTTITETLSDIYSNDLFSASPINPTGALGSILSLTGNSFLSIPSLFGASGKLIGAGMDIYNSSKKKSKNTKLEALNNYITEWLDDNENLTLNEVYEKADTVLKSYKFSYDEIEEVYNNIQEQAKKHQDFLNQTKQFLQDIGLVEKEVAQEVKETDKEFVKLSEDAQKTFDKLSVTSMDISGITDAFSKLTQAMGEYADTKKITVDSYTNFMSLDTGYLIQLFDEEGQLKNTTKAQEDLYKAKIDEMAITQSRNLISLAKTYYSEEQSLDNLKTMVENATGSTWDLVYAELSELKALGATNEELEPLIKQIQTYQSMAESAKKSVSSFTKEQTKLSNSTQELKDKLDAIKNEKDEFDDVISFIEDKVSTYISNLETLRDNELTSIEEQVEAINDEKTAFDNLMEDKISAIEKEKDAYDDLMDKQKEALEDLKDAESDYWDNKKDELEKEKKARERNIALQEKQLKLAEAKSKKVMVYEEGKGFVYKADDTEVAKARQEVKQQEDENAYNEKIDYYNDMKEASNKYYSDEIDTLDKNKKEKDKYYNDEKTRLKEEKELKDRYFESEKERLDDEKKAIKSHYEEIIDYYKNWLSNFKVTVKDYQNSEIELNAEQLTGIDWENDNWTTRLENMSSFVAKYKEKLDELKKATEEYNQSNIAETKENYTKDDVSDVSFDVPFFVKNKYKVVDETQAMKKASIWDILDNPITNSIVTGITGIIDLADKIQDNAQLNMTINNLTIDGANITDANSFMNSLKQLPSVARQKAFSKIN